MKAIRLLSICVLVIGILPVQAQTNESRVVIDSEGWKLIGDLNIPVSDHPVPAVLMLNKAGGNRKAYVELSDQLAKRGIASFRMDMRGHGESTNLGTFVPAEADSADRELLIWQSETDVINATHYLKGIEGINASKIGIIGASYSGEEMAEAGRKDGYVQVYVALSPGSFSDESIKEMDNGIPWLFIISRNERYLHEIANSVQKNTTSVEILYVPGEQHATRILESRPDIAERIAVWLARQFQSN